MKILLYLNAIKGLISKLDETGALQLATGKERHTTALSIVGEAIIAIPELFASPSNATVSRSSIAITDLNTVNTRNQQK